jgi:hypothetical protein
MKKLITAITAIGLSVLGGSAVGGVQEASAAGCRGLATTPQFTSTGGVLGKWAIVDCAAGQRVYAQVQIIETDAVSNDVVYNSGPFQVTANAYGKWSGQYTIACRSTELGNEEFVGRVRLSSNGTTWGPWVNSISYLNAPC